MDAGQLKVGGFTPFTATDYPGHLAAVVFVQGCAWRCGYCHNPHLQSRPKRSPLAWSSVLKVLQKRAGLIDGVVFSGGEPTTDPALPAAVEEVRALGFKVGLHTACIYPDRLRELLPKLDWVGFDVKAPFDRYAAVTGAPGSGVDAEACARAILESGIPYECRTTVHPTLLKPDGIISLASTLADMGVKNYVLQEFRAQGCGDGALNAGAVAGYPGPAIVSAVSDMFPHFTMRRSH